MVLKTAIYYAFFLLIIISCVFYNPESLSMINQISNQNINFISLNLIGSIIYYIFGKISFLIPSVILINFNKHILKLKTLYIFYMITVISGIACYYKIDGGTAGFLLSNFSLYLFEEEIANIFLFILLICSVIISLNFYISVYFFKQYPILINKLNKTLKLNF